MTTYARSIADGTTAIFTVPCPYIEQAHIKVRTGGFLNVLGVHYDFINATQIRFRPGFEPVANTTVEVRRETPSEVPLVVYQDGAILTDNDLNTATLQNLFISQEVKDYYEAALVAGFNRLTNGNAVAIQDAIDAAVQSVLDSELLADLQSRISDIDSNAEAILEQASRLDGIDAVITGLLEIDGVGIATYVTNLTETMTTADEALAARIALIGAEADGGTAFILDLDTVHVGPSESLAGRLTTISSTLDGNSAAIEEVATVTDGLTAQYMVKLDVNGHVTGFGLYNTGATSEFIVLANKFSIVDPSNSANVKVPFTVSGGVVYMQNVVIGNALIADLQVSKLTSGTLNADVTMGTGRIIWSNGVNMKVAGVGFGSSNQFIEWFGPYFSNLSSCTEANAITYLKTNGSAYFGGSLSAGTLTTKVSTSSTSTTAEAETAVFGSNGGTISVVLSFGYQANVTTSYPGTPPGDTGGSQSIIIDLYRDLAGGGYSLVATLTATGTWSLTYGGSPGAYTVTQVSVVSGSLTYTDPTNSTQNRQYKAVRRSSPDAMNPLGLTPFQNISVICVE